MGETKFPYGVSSMGVPVFGNQGFMTPGKSYFLDPVNGNDSYDGKNIRRAKKTLTAAYALLTENQNDVLYYIGGSSAISLKATLTWAKAYTYMIGISSGSMTGGRARIFQDSTATAVTPLFNVTAAGCLFQNLYFYQGVANAAVKVCVNLASTATKVVFDNCHIYGISDDAQDVDGACSLKLDGCDENSFINCRIGGDTKDAGSAATSAEIIFDDEASKNYFIDCMIYRRIEHNTNHPLLYVADALGIGAHNWFKRCCFLYTATSQAYHGTAVVKYAAAISSKTRIMIFQDCMSIAGDGATALAWDADSRGVTVTNMIAPTASAGGGKGTWI